MKKLWILRQRIEWHNCDPYDETMAFATKDMAKTAMTKEFNALKRRFKKSGYEFIDEEEKIGGECCRFLTCAEDWYLSWIEEIKFRV